MVITLRGRASFDSIKRSADDFVGRFQEPAFFIVKFPYGMVLFVSKKYRKTFGGAKTRLSHYDLVCGDGHGARDNWTAPNPPWWSLQSLIIFLGKQKTSRRTFF